LAIGEGIFTGHYLIQSKNCRINCARSFNFYDQKDGGGNAPTTKKNINKLSAKPTKEEKEKEVVVYQNITPL
jgi:hypothetical protein